MTILPILDYGDIIYRSADKGALEWLDVFLPFGHQISHQCSLHDISLYSILLCKLVLSVFSSQHLLVDAYL